MEKYCKDKKLKKKLLKSITKDQINRREKKGSKSNISISKKVRKHKKNGALKKGVTQGQLTV